MRQAEKEMARHQRRLDRLEAELQAASGHQEMARVGAELVGVQAELADVEERWLLLAEGPERDG
jgi:chromosome segregation ATPase